MPKIFPEKPTLIARWVKLCYIAAVNNVGKLIRFGWAMKHMLRDKANFGILEWEAEGIDGEIYSNIEMLAATLFAKLSFNSFFVNKI